MNLGFKFYQKFHVFGKANIYMLSNKITACIFAWNEENRILRCIDNFKDTFEILVVDNYSSDRTVEISRAAGYRCITVKNPGFIETPEVMDQVMSECMTDYILVASVSEFVPLCLQKFYAQVAEKGDHDVVQAFRVSITAGKEIHISGTPNRKSSGEIRFFRKGAVSFEENMVHGRGFIKSAKRTLNVVGDARMRFFQFRDYDCSRTEIALCRYDDVLAKQRFEKGERFSWSRAIVFSLKSFASSYLRNGSYRFGMLGFLHCYYRAHMEFTVQLRLWELQHGFDLASVTERNDAKRRSMEEAFLGGIREIGGQRSA